MRFLLFWVIFVRFRAFFRVLVGCCTRLRVFAYFSALGVPLVALGTLLGALGTLLGRSWGALGRSWALLGRSWGALGPLLESSWALLGAPGPPWADLGWIFNPQRVHFGASRGGFSTLRGSIGVRVGDDLRVTCERLAADFERT